MRVVVGPTLERSLHRQKGRERTMVVRRGLRKALEQDSISNGRKKRVFCALQQIKIQEEHFELLVHLFSK